MKTEPNISMNLRTESDACADVERGNYLIALLEAPASMFTPWQQGFIAALTMPEKDVDDMIKLLADQPLPRRAH